MAFLSEALRPTDALSVQSIEMTPESSPGLLQRQHQLHGVLPELTPPLPEGSRLLPADVPVHVGELQVHMCRTGTDSITASIAD